MGKKRRKTTVCSNCNYRFEGIDNYCPNCGQENHSHHAPIQHLFFELLEGLAHFDTKFFNTAKALFLRPGQITNDYVADRRARYVPPLRLYVFVSFIFFFSLSLLTKTEQRPVIANTDAPSRSAKGNLQVNILGENIITDSLAHQLHGRTDVTDVTIDSLLDARNVDGWFRRMIYTRSIKRELGIITEEDINHAFIKNIGFALFLLMPLFAALLKLFYINKNRFYIEHLIFSVHLHSFILALLVVQFLIQQFVSSEELIAVGFLLMLAYGGVAMQKVYRDKWWVTTIKSIFLFSLYCILLFIMFLVTAIVSVVMA